LNEPRRCSSHNLAKKWTVKVAIYCCWPEELGVVASVEGLEPELELFGFRVLECPQQRDTGNLLLDPLLEFVTRAID